MAHRLARGLRAAARTVLSHQQSKSINSTNHVFNQPIRNYMSTMRKAAFEENICRLIRSEIQYEIDNSPAPQHVPEFNEFKVDERPGEQWIQLTRKFGENEEIKVEVTMREKADDNDDSPNDVKNPISLIIHVFKGEDNGVLQFVCAAWPGSVEVYKVYTRAHDERINQPYMGPPFEDLDDNLQYALYDFLEERGIDENLCMFLHRQMKSKDKNEYMRWMEKVKSFVQKK